MRVAILAVLISGLALPGHGASIHTDPYQDGTGQATSDVQSVIFVIRVDDILSRNMTYQPRSIVPFQAVVEQRGGRITWGVMPHRFLETANQDGVLEEELRESAQKGHEISQHGYIHICKECGQSSHEMSCTVRGITFNIQEQSELIQQGLTLLEERIGVTPTSFIPPGHVANAVTYSALKEKGFPYISTAAARGELAQGLHNLPADEEYTWGLDESAYRPNLDKALEDIEGAFSSRGVFTLMMHDPFTRQGYNNGITLRWMGELLDSLNARYADRIRYLTVTEALDVLTATATSLSDQRRPETESPGQLALSQNTPNPFNPSTRIHFSLPSAGHVHLGVYDLHGRRLRTLVNNEVQAGEHTIDADLVDLPSGTYLYRLDAGQSRLVRMMTLIK